MRVEDFLRSSPGFLAHCLDDALRNFLRDLCSTGIRPRKAALKVLRVGVLPSDQPRLAAELGLNSSSTFELFEDAGRKVLNYYSWFEALRRYLPHAAIRSWLSSIVRSAPFFTTRWMEIEMAARQESAQVEKDASTSPPEHPRLNFSCWFGTNEDRDLPLHPRLGSRARPASIINHRLRKWRDGWADRKIYPVTSKKHGASGIDQSVYNATGLQGEWTGEDLELLYHLSGWYPNDVGVEMRQAWFFNDLKPRTYYAYGGDSSSRSRYVQPIFNSLLDAFQVTHRFRRFRMERLNLLRDHVLFVYDYSSFTSSFDQQKDFIDHLAEFCQGVRVVLFDSHEGYMAIDMSELLTSYNVVNDHYPCIPSAAMRELGVEEFWHTRAGYLGVHGNLASCTLIHGLLAFTITEDQRLCSVVGDDGLLATEIFGPLEMEADDLEEGEISAVEEVLSYLRLIGRIATEKSSITDLSEEDVEWTYLKRPLRSFSTATGRVELVLHYHYPFPNPGLLTPPGLTSRMKPGLGRRLDRFQAFLRELVGLRDFLTRHPPDAGLDAEFLLEYFADVYAFFDLAPEGAWNQTVDYVQHRGREGSAFPPFRSNVGETPISLTYPACPETVEDLQRSERELLLQMPSPPATLLVDDVSGVDLDVLEDVEERGEVGDVVTLPSSAKLRMLRILGFVHTTKRRKVCSTMEEFVLALFPDARSRPVYTVTFLRPVPWFLCSRQGDASYLS